MQVFWNGAIQDGPRKNPPRCGGNTQWLCAVNFRSGIFQMPGHIAAGRKKCQAADTPIAGMPKTRGGASPEARTLRGAEKKRRLHRLFLISPSAPGRIVLHTIQPKPETAAAVRLAPFWPKTRPMAPGAEMAPTAHPPSDGGRVRLRRARCRHACKPDRLRPD